MAGMQNTVACKTRLRKDLIVPEVTEQQELHGDSQQRQERNSNRQQTERAAQFY